MRTYTELYYIYIIYIFYHTYIYSIYNLLSTPCIEVKQEPQSVTDHASFFVWYVQRITKTLACPGLLHTGYQRTMHGVVLAAC